MKGYKAKEQHIQKRDGAKKKKTKPKDGQSEFHIDNLSVPSTNVQDKEGNNEEEAKDEDEADNEIDDELNDHDDGEDNDKDDEEEECKLCKLLKHFNIYRRYFCLKSVMS